MKYARITTPNRPAAPPMTAIEEIQLGPGLYCRVVVTRGIVDPRSLPEGRPQADLDNLVTLTKKAVQIDVDGNLVSQPNGLASGTRTTYENVDTTSIGDTHTWRPGWVRLPPPAAINWHAGELPDGCVAAAAFPEAPLIGDQVYIEPNVYRYDAGIIAAAVDAKGDELLRIIANSAQLAGTEF